jgi:hypothetical protein
MKQEQKKAISWLNYINYISEKSKSVKCKTTYSEEM